MLLTFLFSLSVALTNVFPNSAPQNTNILASSKSAFDAQLSSGANISSCAEVTVFTHGMGGSYADWLASGDGWIKNEGFFPFEISHENVFVLDASNTAATYNPGAFFDAGSLSIVPLVFNEAGTHFRKASISTYPVDFSKQIILVYSGINDVNQATTNEAVYFHFEHSIDTFLYSLSNEIGIVPKINLIGHSRGGITNLLYAMDHPQIVNNLISVGTPYGGSKLLKIINTYLGSPLQETLVSYQPLLNETSFNGYADRWNALGEKPSAKFIGVYQQYDYLIDNILYYVGNDSFFFDIFSLGVNPYFSAKSLRFASRISFIKFLSI